MTLVVIKHLSEKIFYDAYYFQNTMKLVVWIDLTFYYQSYTLIFWSRENIYRHGESIS